MNVHRIQRVAKLTGLSKDVIRIWERRYGLVKPLRSANRYRSYTDDEVALLRYVKLQLDQGQSIGDLVAMGREQLAALAVGMAREAAPHTPPYHRLLEELTMLLDPLNREAFERRLNGAVAVIPFEEALFGILLPLQTRIGDLWHQGKISVAVEHYVTNQVRQKLFSAMNQLPVHMEGPHSVVGCPPGEHHEVGAQAAAYISAVCGCRTYYLGANVPFREWTTFCRRIDPDFVLLSVTTPPGDEGKEEWSAALRELGAPHRTIFLGGAAASGIGLPAGTRNIELISDLASLQRRLPTLFKQGPASSG